jgi:hypothetical protein
MNTIIRLFPCVIGIAAGAVSAAPLREGEFTRVINDVRILPGDSSPVPATVGARISGSSAVATGAQSRAELRFSDNTLTRVGANSVFRMDLSSRTVDMEKGVILLQVPKQLGGAKVRTAAVTAAVTGTTILLEFTKDGFMKIIVIEGEVDVFLNERRNQFRTLTSGDMWISRTNDKSGLPQPVQVDLELLKKTSKLLSEKEFGPLGNQKYMTAALDDQGRKKEKGELTDTMFQIQGRGRNVGFLLGNRQHIPAEDFVGTPEDNKARNIPGTTVFENQSGINTSNPSFAYNSTFDGFGPLLGTNYLHSEDGPFGLYMFDDPQAFSGLDALLAEKEAWHVLKFDELYISGNPSVDTSEGPANLIMGATGDINFTDTPPIIGSDLDLGNLWTLDSGLETLVFTSLEGFINFDRFNMQGSGQDVLMFAEGLASDVNIIGAVQDRDFAPDATFPDSDSAWAYTSAIILPEGNFEAGAGRDVNIAGAEIEAATIKATSGRDVNLGSAEAGAAKLAASSSIQIKAARGVKISNSSELRRLSQLDNPEILIEALDGSVEVAGNSTVDADVATMTTQRGDVRLADSSIAARIIKARVFDSGGILLVSNSILGRGTNASDLIRLYGEGSGGVRFVGDTTLNGSNVQIAGSTVSIDSGSRVRLSNPGGTTVFADSHLYNNGGINGNFTGLSNSQSGAQPVQVNQQPFGSRPTF